jgi:hypothetical protein
MTLRHAAALALVGWYLMFPHLRDADEAATRLKTFESLSKKVQPNGRPPASVFFNLDAPLGQWSIAGSFDTAASCEKTRGQFVYEALKHRSSPIDEADYMSGQCIATDDPRLKAK